VVHVDKARITEVADDVFFAQGPDVNWVLLRDGTDVTLIDAGYPGYVKAVAASIRSIGATPQSVRAILLTHAHIDHIGAVNALHGEYNTPVYLDPVEVGHAHRDYREQAGPGDVVKQILRPGVLPWSLRIMREGAMKDVTIAHALPFPSAGPLDLPGHPTPVATHGHTSGHSAFHLADKGVVISGDGLITAHAVSLRSGPQVIPSWFAHGDQLAGLDPLEGLDADLLLPGHGDAHRGPIAAAVQSARDHARR
jgi:glyoxylase-like metal-dependent hydrolase (beta-lactamase superfamily II)